MRTIDKAKLNEYIDAGLIMTNPHPSLPLSILNYTRTAQFDKVWNEYTLNCRGLVIDDDYNIVARAFPKFFNIEEHPAEEIPNLPFEAFEKMDGSLGIIFNYADQWHIATRGSFVSDQAIRALKILKTHDLSNMDKMNSYLVEIIYPENRIVVNYGDAEMLVLLGIIENETGREYSYDEMLRYSFDNWDSIDIVKRYDGVNDIKVIQALDEDNREGYIIKFSNGFRVKVKFAEYCRLHRIITHVSTREIWEYLREGKDLSELIERVPDEFDAWVKETIRSLNEAFANVDNDANNEYNMIIYKLGEGYTRKDFAALALKSELSGILFRIFEGKNYDDFIWKLVKPEWSKPFKEIVEE